VPTQTPERYKKWIADNVSQGKGFRLTFFHWKNHTVVAINIYAHPSSVSGWGEELGQNLSSVSSQLPASLFEKIPSDIRQELIDTGILKEGRYNLDNFLAEHNISYQREYLRPLIPGMEGSGHLWRWHEPK